VFTSGPAANLMRADTLEEIDGVATGIAAHPNGDVPISFAS
jgi:ferric hydroxamate transport system ATP-binding protein